MNINDEVLLSRGDVVRVDHCAVAADLAYSSYIHSRPL